jgi:molybdopterin synthase sulfur carrier subunit
MPEVWLPPRLQRLTGGRQTVQVAGQTVRQVIENLERAFPGLQAELYDAEEDILMPGMAVVVDGETSQLGLLETVRETSELHFIPALGGGLA